MGLHVQLEKSFLVVAEPVGGLGDVDENEGDGDAENEGC
jgi:hypothetical protein